MTLRQKAEWLTCLSRGITRQGRKKFSLPFGIQPSGPFKLIVKAPTLCGQPDLMQGFLQVDDDLTVVGKHQSNHAASALIVNIRSGFVVDTVAARLYGLEQTLCVIHEFGVSHYNFTMLLIPQILVRAIALGACAVALAACGQQGPLYLPKNGAPQTISPPLKPAPPPATAASRP